jgi:hypothetical protein
MPFKKRTSNRKPKRFQKQNTKRNSPSMRKYGENNRQQPRMILNTIQPASYTPQSVTIRHTYDNTAFVSSLLFTKDVQENFHLNFLPNSLLIFNTTGANKSYFKYGRPVQDVFSNDGSTTALDDVLTGGAWGEKYKKAQVMATHYNFNIRQMNSSNDSSVQPDEKIQPLQISFVRSHQSGTITNTTTCEDIQKMAFTQTRYLGKGRTQNDGVVNLKSSHYPARFNGAQKNYINNVEYCITPGQSVDSANRMLPPEKDFVSLVIGLPSSALHKNVTDKKAISGDLLIRMRVSAIVRYSEVANGNNVPLPNQDTVIVE